jgi:hypothetical protein
VPALSHLLLNTSLLCSALLLPFVSVQFLSSDQTPTVHFILTTGTELMGVYSWAQTEDRQAVIVLNRP